MSEFRKMGFKMIEEDSASAEVRQLYDDFKRNFQSPTVPNYIKAFGESPESLRLYMGVMSSVYQNLSLPQALTAMICFTIATKNQCLYCSSLHEVTCRTLGVDEDTLTALAEDLNEVNPLRIRAIMEFAVKAAKKSKEVTAEDYENLRNLGVSNNEIMQIVFIAGIAVFNDILADSFKIEVDPEVNEALGKS